MTKITLEMGDITKQQTDAIVNAANTSLLGGGGVDGAIHRAAGKELLHECRLLHGCKTGQAKVTKGYLLPAKYIIHTPGPHWNGGKSNEKQLLHDSYFNSLVAAKDKGARTIAFPNISTGIYGFPKKEAAIAALTAVNDFCKQYPDTMAEIIFVCFDDENYNVYKDFLS